MNKDLAVSLLESSGNEEKVAGIICLVTCINDGSFSNVAENEKNSSQIIVDILRKVEPTFVLKMLVKNSTDNTNMVASAAIGFLELISKSFPEILQDFNSSLESLIAALFEYKLELERHGLNVSCEDSKHGCEVLYLCLKAMGLEMQNQYNIIECLIYQAVVMKFRYVSYVLQLIADFAEHMQYSQPFSTETAECLRYLILQTLHGSSPEITRDESLTALVVIFRQVSLKWTIDKNPAAFGALLPPLPAPPPSTLSHTTDTTSISITPVAFVTVFCNTLHAEMHILLAELLALTESTAVDRNGDEDGLVEDPELEVNDEVGQTDGDGLATLPPAPVHAATIANTDSKVSFPLEKEIDNEKDGMMASIELRSCQEGEDAFAGVLGNRMHRVTHMLRVVLNLFDLCLPLLVVADEEPDVVDETIAKGLVNDILDAGLWTGFPSTTLLAIRQSLYGVLFEIFHFFDCLKARNSMSAAASGEGDIKLRALLWRMCLTLGRWALEDSSLHTHFCSALPVMLKYSDVSKMLPGDKVERNVLWKSLCTSSLLDAMSSSETNGRTISYTLPPDPLISVLPCLLLILDSDDDNYGELGEKTAGDILFDAPDLVPRLLVLTYLAVEHAEELIHICSAFPHQSFGSCYGASICLCRLGAQSLHHCDELEKRSAENTLELLRALVDEQSANIENRLSIASECKEPSNQQWMYGDFVRNILTIVKGI